MPHLHHALASCLCIRKAQLAAMLAVALCACARVDTPAAEQVDAESPPAPPQQAAPAETPSPQLAETAGIGEGVSDTGIDLASVLPQDPAMPPSTSADASTAPGPAQDLVIDPADLVTAAEGDAALAKDSPLRAQVLLERAFFSPSEIDGAAGSNQARAVKAYQEANDLEPTGQLDQATWDKLDTDTAPILVRYTLTEADIAGPYRAIPEDTMAKAELDALPYSSVEEALGEKFHASPALLRKLNPQADFSRAGTVLTVPNVAAAETLPTPERVVVDKSLSALQIVDASDRVLAQFPVTTGSAQFPLPIGEWKINGVARDPVWHFNPALIAGTKRGDRKAIIPAGPNNPVGVRWIDLSKEHYGIHGTAEPAKIGKSESNGCIRMTNWSVLALSKVVKPGMTAVLRE
jgi:lipoprotein-anchoring transpeptidase ErfK/SrfK